MSPMFGQLARTGLAAVSLRHLQRRLRHSGHAVGIVLVYHHVAPPGAFAPYQAQSHAVVPEVFRSQLQELLEADVPIVPLPAFQADDPPPGLRVAISFDDGYQSVRDHAWPILEDLGLPVTLFICSGAIGEGYLWRDVIYHALATEQVADYLADTDDPALHGDLRTASKTLEHYDYHRFRELSAAYVTRHALADELRALYMSPETLAELKSAGAHFGNHSHSHPLFAGLTRAELDDEVSRCRDFLLAHDLAAAPHYLAMPFGLPRQDHPESAELELRGYLRVCAGLNPLPAGRLIDRFLAPATVEAFSGELKVAAVKVLLGRA